MYHVTPVAVEYDGKTGRVTKSFPDAYPARRFYAKQFRAGKNPNVRRVNPATQQETTTMAKNSTSVETNGATHGLNKREAAILEALSKGPLNRADLKAKSGIASGIASLVGAVTKPGNGVAGDAGLAGRGLVKAEKHEGEPISFSITAAGRKALEKSKKVAVAK